jgi:hypothetical protein
MAVTDETSDLAAEPANQLTASPSTNTSRGHVTTTGQPIAENQPEQRSHVDPVSRGGAPRGTRNGHAEQAPVSRVSDRPDLLCYLRGRTWQIALGADENRVGDYAGAYQRERELQRAEGQENAWLLEDVTAEVVLKSAQGEMETFRIPACGEQVLNFRLTGNLGHSAKPNGSGAYLVIVPASWQRDEVISGPPSSEPEPTSLEGFRAHYFEIGDGDHDRIAFVHLGRAVWAPEYDAPAFRLDGDIQKDATPHCGSLFAGGPPVLVTDRPEAWANVKEIVVGEEGPGRGKWRTSFKPAPESGRQEFPPQLAERRGGWFFARIYDYAGDLTQSLDFRFHTSLKEIIVPPFSPPPEDRYYENARISIIHGQDLRVSPVHERWKNRLMRVGARTIIVVYPNPEFDESEWDLGPILFT